MRLPRIGGVSNGFGETPKHCENSRLKKYSAYLGGLRYDVIVGLRFANPTYCTARFQIDCELFKKTLATAPPRKNLSGLSVTSAIRRLGGLTVNATVTRAIRWRF
ncbi:hypothetical protein [Rubinisphaera sp.]|uniref:hypothetical protein n=1 Tax=Rubinisphaera sp. TaxID=2024857 RepID=UPI000C122556|nr:hypothetical protein [Rubinisphaera sp.]MBV07750.1 hypothetical protein [Rubinisphaera sp.]|tara:strand:- start:11706 stop:12020 length:315 start_codon:yes stop_codon:yes gene_type:complete